MNDRYSISTGYTVDTDRYDACVCYDDKTIAELYLDEITNKIVINFNNDFTSKQPYNLSEFVKIIQSAEKTFREYLAGGEDPIYPSDS